MEFNWTEQRSWTLKYIVAILGVELVHVFDRMIDADVISTILLLVFFIYSLTAFFWNSYIAVNRLDIRWVYRPTIIAIVLLAVFYLRPLAYFNYVNLAVFHWYYDRQLLKSGKVAESFAWGGGWDPTYLIHFKDGDLAREMFETNSVWQMELMPGFAKCSSSWERLTNTYYMVQFSC